MSESISIYLSIDLSIYFMWAPLGAD